MKNTNKGKIKELQCSNCGLWHPVKNNASFIKEYNVWQLYYPCSGCKLLSFAFNTRYVKQETV